MTAFFVSQSNLKSLFKEPFTLIVSHDRYEVDNNAASACLQSDKVVKRQMEMRGEWRGGWKLQRALERHMVLVTVERFV